MADEAETADMQETGEISSEAAEETSNVPEDPTGDGETVETPEKDYKAEYESLQVALQKEREKNRLRKEQEGIAARSAATLQPDEEGNIDPEQLIQVAEDRALAKFELRQHNEQLKNQALKKYPELEDPELMEIVELKRMNHMAKTQEYVTYEDIAASVLGKFNRKTEAAVTKAKADLTTSERVQARAAGTPPSSQGEQPDERTELRRIVATGSKKEAMKAMERLASMSSGK